MNSTKLIEIATKKGYNVGRKHSKLYRYSWTDDNGFQEKYFKGNFREFVQFVKELPSL